MHRKYLVENIRVALMCPNQQQLIYTQSCYEFSTENEQNEIANVHKKESEVDQLCLSFAHDWTRTNVIDNLLGNCFSRAEHECLIFTIFVN